MTKLIRIRSLLILAAVVFLSGSGCSSHGEGPAFEEAWVRAIPPGMKMTAGFGRLSNRGSKVIEFNAFSSSSFDDVSLHRTELHDGISKMLEVPVLSIEAGETVVLEPGSYHLMLMMPRVEIQPGQLIDIEMIASDGRSITFQVPVEER